MARRSYDRMYKNRDKRENDKVVSEEKTEEISLPKDEVEKKTPETGTVIGGLNLNVRQEPSANGKIITTIRDGARVEIVEIVNEEWYHIASPNGYVMKKYVQV